MLTEIYIDALLVDEEAADQAWEAWDTVIRITYRQDHRKPSTGYSRLGN